MKKLIKNNLLGFILGGLIFGGIVYASSYLATDISYTPTDTSWEVSNVNEAINSLYNNVTELENIKSVGDATAAQILTGKKAVVKGSAITGSMVNRGAWTNIPTTSGKITIPAGYHNGSGYVDTSSVYTNGYNTGVATSSIKITEIGTSDSSIARQFDVKAVLPNDYKNLTINNFFISNAKIMYSGGTKSSDVYILESYDATTGTLYCNQVKNYSSVGGLQFYIGYTIVCIY